MAFDKLAMELMESVFKNIEHPGKHVPIPDSAFPDTSMPEIKEAMAKLVTNEGNDLKKIIAGGLLRYIVGELHAQGRTNTEPQRVEPRQGIDGEPIYVGTADQYAAVPYRSRMAEKSNFTPGSPRDIEYIEREALAVKEGNVKGVRKTALYRFNPKGEFLDVRFDGFGGRMASAIEAGEYEVSTYSPDGKMPVTGYARQNFSDRLKKSPGLDAMGLYNALISKQPVSVGKMSMYDADEPAAPITDDADALKLIKAIYPIMVGMSGVAKSAGKYERVSPLDTNERAMLTPTYGYKRDYNFTLTANAKLDGLSAADMKLIEDGLTKTVRRESSGFNVTVSANGVKISNISKNVYLALGRRDSRVDGETMGSLD